jgi:hypothetical protein
MANTLTYDPSNDPEITAAEEERDAELLSIGEGLQNAQDTLLAGKFQDAEALEKAYIELQKLTSRKFAAKSTEDELSQNEEEGDPTDGEEQNDLEDEEDESSSFLNSIFDEINELGSLSQETADALGEDVAQALETLAANQQQSVALSPDETLQVQSIVGGPEAYGQMIQWSSSNLSQGERDAYNEVMDSGNINAIYWAVKGLQSSYQNAVGYDGQMLQGRSASNDGQTFRSMAELVRAQSDPRYDKDPAYRADVESKLIRSVNL